MSNQLYMYPAGLDHVVHREQANIMSAPIILTEDNESLLNMILDDYTNASLLIPSAKQGVWFQLPVNHMLMLYMVGPNVIARLIQWQGLDYLDISRVEGFVPGVVTPIQDYLDELQESLMKYDLVSMIQCANTTSSPIVVTP